MLTEAKSAFFESARGQLNAAIDQAFAQRDELRDMPPTGTSTTTWSYALPAGPAPELTTCEADDEWCEYSNESAQDRAKAQKLDGTLTFAYQLETAKLRVITAETPLDAAIRAISLSSSVDFQLVAAAPAFDLDNATLKARAEMLAKDGFAYFRLASYQATGFEDESMTSSLEEALQKGWVKVDLVAEFGAEASELTAGDLRDGLEAFLVNENASLGELLQLFIDPSQADRLLVRALAERYIDQVWLAAPIFAVESADQATARLAFGPAEMRGLIARHAGYLQDNFDAIVAASKRTHPYGQLASSDMTSREVTPLIRELQREASEAVADLPTAHFDVAFAAEQVAHVRYLQTWQEDAGSEWDCSARRRTEEGGMEETCAEVARQRNLHLDLRYYLNGSLDPLKHAIDGYFATRVVGDPAASTANLKIFPVKDGQQASRVTFEYVSISGSGADRMVSGKLAGTADWVVDAVTAATRSFQLNTNWHDFDFDPDYDDVSDVDFALDVAATDDELTATGSLATQPASVAKFDFDLVADRTASDFTLSGYGQDDGRRATIEIGSQYRGQDAQPTITVPAGALAAPSWDESEPETDESDDLGGDVRTATAR